MGTIYFVGFYKKKFELPVFCYVFSLATIRSKGLNVVEHSRSYYKPYKPASSKKQKGTVHVILTICVVVP